MRVDLEDNEAIKKLFQENDNIGALSNIFLRPMRKLMAEGSPLGPMTAFHFPLPGEGSLPFEVLTWTEKRRLIFWPILPKLENMNRIVDHITLEFPSRRSHLTAYKATGKAIHRNASNLGRETRGY
jgi:hypothetical protein